MTWCLLSEQREAEVNTVTALWPRAQSLSLPQITRFLSRTSTATIENHSNIPAITGARSHLHAAPREWWRWQGWVLHGPRDRRCRRDRADIVITRLRPRVNSGVFLVLHMLSHKPVCLYQQLSLKSWVIDGSPHTSHQCRVYWVSRNDFAIIQ